MRAPLPVDGAVAHQAQIGFVHQGGGLQGVITPLTAHVISGYGVQFTINHFRQHGFRASVAPLDCSEQGGDLSVNRHGIIVK